ncbi:MAG: hypothetical protein AAF652_13770 [Cyanobacteria bacterium P01_C01_bin.72]
MSTPNCSDFVTRTEYNALLARLDELLYEIQLVQLDLTGHKSLDVPQAHNYRPQFEVVTELNNNELITAVVIEGESQNDVVELPNSVVSNVTCDIFDQSDGSYVVKIGVNGEFDEDILTLPEPEQLDFTITEINLGQFDFEIVLGEQLKTQTLNISVPDDNQPELTQSNLVLDAEYNEVNNVLTITIADGESSATARVLIDANVINDFGGGGNSVSCENFSQELTNCCADLSQEFQDCCGQLLSAIATNLQKIQELEQYVTIDISGSVCSDYSCDFPKDESEQPLLTYAEATLTKKEFEGKGIAGLNERLKYLATNQDAIYKEICKAIDPITKIYRDDLYQFCNNSGISRNDYPDTTEGTEQYTAAVDIYLAELVSQSKYGPLINAAAESENGVLLSAPASYINGILADFALIQGRNNHQALCGISEAEPEVVTLIASEKELGRIEGKVLVLHFVTLDNYPKRTKGSNKRPIQIPAPKEDYDWDTDFANIRWVQGNQYAKLKLKGYKQGITGWFQDAAAANSCFDQLLSLTTAEEQGRNIPDHTNGREDIPVRTSRPYRAFLSCEDVPGEPQTLITYHPPQDEESN